MLTRMTPLRLKDIAEKFLVWLKDNNISVCPKTYDVIKKCSEEIDEPIYDLWKAYNLLRTMGRIELQNPNGKYGFRVLDYTPLSVLVLKTEEFKNQIEKEMLVKILKTLKKRFSYIWDESLEVLK